MPLSAFWNKKKPSAAKGRPIKEAISIDEKSDDVAKESSTPVIKEQVNITEDYEKQVVEKEVNKEPIISTKKVKDTTGQPSEEVKEPTKRNC